MGFGDFLSKTMRAVGFVINCGMLTLGIYFMTQYNVTGNRWWYAGVKMDGWISCGYFAVALLFCFFGTTIASIEASALANPGSIVHKFQDPKHFRTRKNLGLAYIWGACLCYSGHFDLYGGWKDTSHWFGVWMFGLGGLNILYAMFLQESVNEESNDLPGRQATPEESEYLDGGMPTGGMARFVRGLGFMTNCCAMVLGVMCFIEYARRTEFYASTAVFSAISMSALFIMAGLRSARQEVSGFKKFTASSYNLLSERYDLCGIYSWMAIACIGGICWPLFLANTDFWVWFTRATGFAYAFLWFCNACWSCTIKVPQQRESYDTMA